jgi:hypothetical protein
LCHWPETIPGHVLKKSVTGALIGGLAWKGDGGSMHMMMAARSLNTPAGAFVKGDNFQII